MFFSNIEQVRIVGGDGFLSTSISTRALGENTYIWQKGGLNVRWVHGKRMMKAGGVFGEFAAALQFPWYFGENWPAFDECLSEVDWISLKSLIVVIFDADVVLIEDEFDLPTLIKALSRAHVTYSQQLVAREQWDRPAIPFHVVLQLTEQGRKRWIDAGVSLVDLNV